MVWGGCQTISSIPPHYPLYIVYRYNTTTYSGTIYSMLAIVEHMFEKAVHMLISGVCSLYVRLKYLTYTKLVKVNNVEQ